MSLAPPTRRLTVIAQDPSVKWAGKIVTSQVEVPAENTKALCVGFGVLEARCKEAFVSARG